MSTTVHVDQRASPHVPTRGLTKGLKSAAIGLLIAVALASVGTIYLSSLVGPADLIAFASAATD